MPTDDCKTQTGQFIQIEWAVLYFMYGVILLVIVSDFYR